MIDGWYAITATADAALAATLRTFVRESAHRLELGDGEIDDLTLITTELLANAVEAGGSEVRLLLEIDEDGWLLRADGVGVLRDDPETTVSRADILNGLAHLTWTEGTLVVRPPLASAP